MTIDDKGLVERFLNPDDALLAAYWRYSPRPIEIDQENADAARKHLANLVRAASDAVLSARPFPALPAEDAGLVADLETMWHFPVPPGDKSARMYSKTAKRAAEALSRREWQPRETAPKDGTRIIVKAVTFGWNSDICQNVATGDKAVEARWAADLSGEPKWLEWCGNERTFPTNGGLVVLGWIPMPPAASQPAGGEGE